MSEDAVLKQIKSLRSELSDLKTDLITKRWDVESLTNRIRSLETDISDLQKELSSEIKSIHQDLFEWKSELFTKIDTAYAKPLKDNLDEHATIQSRLEEHQTDIETLKQNFSTS